MGHFPADCRRNSFDFPHKGLWREEKKKVFDFVASSATLSHLAFPMESNLNFPWEKFQWNNTVVYTCISLTVLFLVNLDFPWEKSKWDNTVVKQCNPPPQEKKKKKLTKNCKLLKAGHSPQSKQSIQKGNTGYPRTVVNYNLISLINIFHQMQNRLAL